MNSKYKKLSEYNESQQKILNRFIHTELPVYIRVIEKTLEFVDFDNKFLHSAVISVAAFVVLDENGSVIDKYIVQLKPFYIRNDYEVETFLDAVSELREDTEFDLTEEEKVYES